MPLKIYVYKIDEFKGKEGDVYGKVRREKMENGRENTVIKLSL